LPQYDAAAHIDGSCLSKQIEVKFLAVADFILSAVASIGDQAATLAS
jgi:hypothetical protein